LLEKRGNEYYAWFGRAYPAELVTQAVHRNQQTPRYWHTYTEEQIQTMENICRSLIAEYAIKYILGHEEISPTRKVDPGPAFPLDKFRNRIFGGDRDQVTSEHAMQTEGTVNTDLLNIRSSSSTSADLVAKPLPRGQKVRIVATKEGWLQVTTEVTGWVSAKFIDS
jgi:N-acetylmuramoyl-L-alanine amidase